MRKIARPTPHRVLTRKNAFKRINVLTLDGGPIAGARVQRQTDDRGIQRRERLRRLLPPHQSCIVVHGHFPPILQMMLNAPRRAHDGQLSALAATDDGRCASVLQKWFLALLCRR